jgi:mannose-6-phosphate isomerase-like protein (cupin superfamily)
MLEPGEVVANTLTGEWAQVRTGRMATGGRLIESDYRLSAGGAVAAAHIHPNQTETFEVLEGEITIRLGKEEFLARPGVRYVALPGVPHRMVNHTEQDATLFSTSIPALRMDELLETVWGLASDGKTNRWGYPNPLRAAAIAAEFSDDMVLAAPPPWVQKLVLRPLLPLARLLSYPGTYVPVSRRRLRPAGEGDAR